MSPNGQCTANFIVDQIHNHIHRSGIIPLDRLQLNSDRIDDDMLDTNDKWYGIGSPSHLLLPRLSTTRTWIRHKQCVADISFLLGWWYAGWLAEPVNWDRCCLPVEICRESMADTEQMRFRVILFCCVKKGHPRLRAIKTNGTGMKGRAGQEGSRRWFIALSVRLLVSHVKPGWRKGPVLFDVYLYTLLDFAWLHRTSFPNDKRTGGQRDTGTVVVLIDDLLCLPGHYSWGHSGTIHYIYYYGTLFTALTILMNPRPVCWWLSCGGKCVGINTSDWGW